MEALDAKATASVKDGALDAKVTAPVKKEALDAKQQHQSRMELLMQRRQHQSRRKPLVQGRQHQSRWKPLVQRQRHQPGWEGTGESADLSHKLLVLCYSVGSVGAPGKTGVGNRSFSLASHLLFVGTSHQGWALRSFLFGTLRSFPF